MSANIYGQLGGLAIGLAGNAIQNSQEKQDRGIANGQEDPALAALRKRMAAQDAQTAMSVAASQQGVNPALAQRNAQQALGQAQVRTNANLAAQNAQSAQKSRQANRGVQQRVVQGTMQGLAGAANLLGTQGAINDAGTANTLGSQGPVTQEEKNKFGGATSALSAPEGAAGLAPAPVAGVMSQEGAAGLGSSLAAQGAAGLSAPVPSTMNTPNGVPNGTVPVAAASPDQMVQAMSPQGLPAGGVPSGQMQMRGGQPQLTGQGLGQIPLNSTTMPNLPVGPGPVAESPLSPASAIPAQIDAPAPRTLTSTEAFSMLPPEVQNEPMNALAVDNANTLRQAGLTEQADALMEQLMARLGQ